MKNGKYSELLHEEKFDPNFLMAQMHLTNLAVAKKIPEVYFCLKLSHTEYLQNRQKLRLHYLRTPDASLDPSEIFV